MKTRDFLGSARIGRGFLLVAEIAPFYSQVKAEGRLSEKQALPQQAAGPPGTPSRQASRRTGTARPSLGACATSLLNETIFYDLDDAHAALERWTADYNQQRPHPARHFGLCHRIFLLSKTLS
jgi:hypothetical protein